MSDAQKLKDTVKLFRKASKDLDDKLNKAEESNRLHRQEQEEQSSRQS